MPFAICRVKKIKHKQSLRNSLKHNLREQETKNADPNKQDENKTVGAKSSAEGVAKLTKRLGELEPPKRKKKDRVLAIEYLITFSPEFAETATRKEQIRYLQDCLNHLKSKHGKENLLNASLHMDERTPHIHVHFVPVVDNKLDAKAAIGGPSGLRKLQDEIGKIGNNYGLMRGVKGSKAKHQTIRQYYSKLKKALKSPVPSNWDLFKHSLKIPQENVSGVIEGHDMLNLELNESKRKIEQHVKYTEKSIERAKSEERKAIEAKERAEREAQAAAREAKVVKMENENMAKIYKPLVGEVEQLREQLAQAQAELKKHEQAERAKIQKSVKRGVSSKFGI